MKYCVWACLLGVTSLFFPGILLSRKPPKILKKWLVFEKNDMGNQPLDALVLDGESLSGAWAGLWALLTLLHGGPLENGCGSKLNRRGYAGFGPCFHLPGFHVQYRFFEPQPNEWFLLTEIPFGRGPQLRKHTLLLFRREVSMSSTLPPGNMVWCTDPTFVLKRGCVQFHVSWWEGTCNIQQTTRSASCAVFSQFVLKGHLRDLRMILMLVAPEASGRQCL